MENADDGGGDDMKRRLYKTRCSADSLKLNVTFTLAHFDTYLAPHPGEK